MNRYTSLIGRRIELVYRCGNVDLYSIGLLLDEAAEYIVIEQHSDQHGSIRAFQLKIPSEWIIRLNQADPDRMAVAN